VLVLVSRERWAECMTVAQSPRQPLQMSGYHTLAKSAWTPKTRLVSIIQNLGPFPNIHLMKKQSLWDSNS